MENESEKISHSGWLALITLSCLGLIAMYAETMVLPAIPAFISDFDISYNLASWILSSYLIAGAVVTPIAGKLSDIYGRKKILLIIMIVYSIGILGGGFAENFPQMIAARVAQGMGIAMFPIAFGIIRETLPEKKLAVGQSIFSATFPMGATIGLLVGANIIENYGWHTTFFTAFPVAVILGLFILKTIKTIQPPKMEKSSIDILGSVILAITVVSFLAGVSILQDNNDTFDSIALFVVSAISLLALVKIEKKIQSPLIDFKLLSNKRLLYGILILLTVGLCTFMVYQTIPIMIQSPQPLGFGGNEFSTAAIQLPFMIVFLIGNISAGFVLNKIGNKRLTMIGTIIGTVGFLSILFFHSTEIMVTSTLAIIAVGLSLAFIGGFNIVLVSTPIRFAGIALGMTLLLNLVGQSIGPTVSGMFQQSYQSTINGVQGSFPTPEAYNMIFFTAFIVSLSSVILALSLIKNKETELKI